MGKSTRWKHWKTIPDLRRCQRCRLLHGKIYAIEERVEIPPPLHNRCRCAILALETIRAGTATNYGINGVDYWLFILGIWPSYYITKEEASALGWKSRNLHIVAPGKMLMGIYQNWDTRLPDAPGRVWYEFDINYVSGKRNSERVLYSNDGLLFVTYDHYHTFHEIVA